MRHSIAVKFLVILLTALSLVTAAAGGLGIIAMEASEMYVNGVEVLQNQEYESIGASIASAYTDRYVADNLSNLPYTIKESMYFDPTRRSDADHWCVQLRQNGVLLSEDGAQSGALTDHVFSKTYTFSPLYPIISLCSPYDLPTESATEPTLDESASFAPRVSPVPEGSVPDGYLYYDTQIVWEEGHRVTYYLYYYPAPEYTVSVYLQEPVLESSNLHILTAIYPYRYAFIAIVALGLLVFAAGLVFLCWSAGAAKDGSIRPGGLNRLPLDLYAVAAVGSIVALANLLRVLVSWADSGGPHFGNLSLIFLLCMCMVLPAIGLVFAFAAQIKVKGGYVWRHSVLGWCCTRLGRGIRFLWRGCRALYALLPVIWQWLLTAFAMAVGVLVCFLLAVSGEDFMIILFFLSILGCAAVVLYGGWAFGTLMRGAKRMSEGDLRYKISTKYLHGAFLDFARKLNTLSEAAMEAAENQMRSERMKSELITNVSHDIKTPLTSIINFVDLLRKPHTPEEGEQYLEVLSRQSERMKKLIEDLMELSKANTGNISVSITDIDAAEAVNQALGEFSDKLADARLDPVFRQPAQPMRIQADGRLVWRILSNLLSNAVKYAMPGTRLYVDLLQAEDSVLISLKNISREPQNISADELMERFVRGDTARNSEGSGLGLNIARSLMEVQRGQLRLLLDGDLFKVTLIFPASES